MVHMNTIEALRMSNNERLRQLVEESGLSQSKALELFNRGLVDPYSLSAWKAYLGSPDSARWRPLGDNLLKHAEKRLGKVKKNA